MIGTPLPNPGQLNAQLLVTRLAGLEEQFVKRLFRIDVMTAFFEEPERLPPQQPCEFFDSCSDCLVVRL